MGTTVSDDEVFIRRIVDSPGDDLPRLVYADWLDERGDPRAAWLRDEGRNRLLSGFETVADVLSALERTLGT